MKSDDEQVNPLPPAADAPSQPKEFPEVHGTENVRWEEKSLEKCH